MTDRPWCSVQDYLAELLALVDGPTCETVTLDDAAGRVLAAPVAARTGVPAFHVSAMDGYAVRWADVTGVTESPVRLRVVADLPAGASGNPALPAGCCARVMTGSMLPSSADTVVPVELTDGGAESVTVLKLPSGGEGAHIRRAFEDVTPGDRIGSVGDRLTPGVISTVAATGHGQVTVARRPRVAVAATGSELRDPDAKLDLAQIHDSNSHFLAPALTEFGAQVSRHDSVPDEADELGRTLDAMADTHDLIVLTGGAGAGAHDVPGQVLASAHRHAFRRVQMQPGKPQGWAIWRDTPVLLLPGNPVAASVSTVVFLRPLIRKILGAPSPRRLTARTGVSLRGAQCREAFVPGRLESGSDGTLTVLPTRTDRGSHLVSAMVDADVLAIIPLDAETVPAGGIVEVIPTGSRRW